MKLHTGDTVIVITGKDKGKTGTVLRVLPNENRVVVEGINIRTRHLPKSVQQAGRIVKYEASLNASKVMIVDPKTGKPSRIGYVIKNGKKMRISKLSGEEVKKGKMPVKAKKTTKDVTESKESKEKTPSKKSSDSSVSSDSSPKKPFWQKMKFGANAVDQAETNEVPHAQKDQSIPQPITHRSGGRGS